MPEKQKTLNNFYIIQSLVVAGTGLEIPMIISYL